MIHNHEAVIQNMTAGIFNHAYAPRASLSTKRPIRGDLMRFGNFLCSESLSTSYERLAYRSEGIGPLLPEAQGLLLFSRRLISAGPGSLCRCLSKT